MLVYIHNSKIVFEEVGVLSNSHRIFGVKQRDRWKGKWANGSLQCLSKNLINKGLKIETKWKHSKEGHWEDSVQDKENWINVRWLLRQKNKQCLERQTCGQSDRQRWQSTAAHVTLKQGWIHGYPSHVRVGRSSAREGHWGIWAGAVS